MNSRELAFCAAYAKTRNPTEAARMAGFSSPRKNAQAILRRPHVQEQVKFLVDRVNENMALDVTRVVVELASVALNRVDEYYKFDAEGRYIAKSPDELTDQQKMAIRSIGVTHRRDEDTGRVSNVYNYQFHDKMAALNKLGDHFGLTKGDEGAKAKGNPFEDMGQEELDAIQLAMEKAMDRRAIEGEVVNG